MQKNLFFKVSDINSINHNIPKMNNFVENIDSKLKSESYVRTNNRLPLNINNTLKKGTPFNNFTSIKLNSIEDSNSKLKLNQCISEVAIIDDLIENNQTKNRLLISSKESIVGSTEAYQRMIYESRPLDKLKNVYESMSDPEYSLNSDLLDFLIILPRSDFRIFLDNFMIILIFYSGITSPIINCYNSDLKNFFFYHELIVEILFILELIVNFFTAYFDEENDVVVKQAERVISHYFNGKFIFDFLCSFPLKVISLILNRNPINNVFIHANNYSQFYNLGSSICILNWITILRLFKLIDYEALKSFEWFKNFKINRIFKYIIMFLYLVHYSTCFWIYLGMSNYTNYNWISNTGQNDNLYITSLYFNLVTIFTIGYGDIVSKNKIEYLYNIFLLLFGINIYTFALTSITAIFMNNNPKYENYLVKRRIIKEINYCYDLSQILITKLENYLKLGLKTNQLDRFDFINALPSSIKQTLTTKMYGELIKEFKFFKEKSNDFIISVLPYLKSHRLKKGQILFSVGEVLEEMYFVIKGSLGLNLGAGYNNFELGIIKENQHFGEFFISQNNYYSPYELGTKSNSASIFILKKNDFLSLKTLFNPEIIKLMNESFSFIENIEKKRKLLNNLFDKFQSKEMLTAFLNQTDNYLFINGFNDHYNGTRKIVDTVDYIMDNDLNTVVETVLRYYHNKPHLLSKKLSYKNLNTLKKKKRKTLFNFLVEKKKTKNDIKLDFEKYIKKASKTMKKKVSRTQQKFPQILVNNFKVTEGKSEENNEEDLNEENNNIIISEVNQEIENTNENKIFSRNGSKFSSPNKLNISKPFQIFKSDENIQRLESKVSEGKDQIRNSRTDKQIRFLDQDTPSKGIKERKHTEMVKAKHQESLIKIEKFKNQILQGNNLDLRKEEDELNKKTFNLFFNQSKNDTNNNERKYSVNHEIGTFGTISPKNYKIKGVNNISYFNPLNININNNYFDNSKGKDDDINDKKQEIKTMINFFTHEQKQVLLEILLKEKNLNNLNNLCLQNVIVFSYNSSKESKSKKTTVQFVRRVDNDVEKTKIASLKEKNETHTQEIFIENNIDNYLRKTIRGAIKRTMIAKPEEKIHLPFHNLDFKFDPKKAENFRINISFESKIDRICKMIERNDDFSKNT